MLEIKSALDNQGPVVKVSMPADTFLGLNECVTAKVWCRLRAGDWVYIVRVNEAEEDRGRGGQRERELKF